MSKRDFFKKVKLCPLLIAQNFTFHINELICKNNFFRKLHPSKWKDAIVQKITNNYFYKVSVSFFKTSCNTIAKMFGFRPMFVISENTREFTGIFHDATKTLGISSLGNRLIDATNSAANALGINNDEEYEEDYNNWCNLVSVTESLKLATTKLIYDSLDSWYSCTVVKSNSNQDLLDAKQLTRTIDSLCNLSSATETVLGHFDSQKSSIRLSCEAKGCRDNEIRTIISDIRKKSVAISKELASCHDQLDRINNSASTSFGHSVA